MSRADNWLSSLRRTLAPSRSGGVPVYAPSDIPLPNAATPLVREVRQYETALVPFPRHALVQQIPPGYYDTITVVWTREEITIGVGLVRQYPRICVRLWEGRYQGMAEGLAPVNLDQGELVEQARYNRLVHVAPPQQHEQVGVCYGGTVIVQTALTAAPYFVTLGPDADTYWSTDTNAQTTSMAITVITERLRSNV